MGVYIAISQFLDGSSNVKAGCKKDAIHDAFDIPFMCHIILFISVATI